MSIPVKNTFTSARLLEETKVIMEEVITTKEEKLHFELRFRELIAKYEQLLLTAEYDDRKSARQGELNRLKAGVRNNTQNILAYIGILAFFCITGYIISNDLGSMDSEESFIIGNLTGMAAAIAKDIYGYYFGSSKGESEARVKR